MPDHIIKQDVFTGYIEEMARYAIADNRRRMIPDIRDGLKPVQRRDIYSLSELNAVSEATKKKCARIVGDCIGKYHPHSTDSIYKALRPIANWWECKIPLVEGHGNFGSIKGDGMAAMRYTEAYLSEFTVEFMQMLKKYRSVVDWSPNFDNTTEEPDYLPFLIPVLLINGASGIGVGLRMELPPHNPKEVIQATRKLLRDPNAEVVLVPDFCMPCDIIDNNWKQISNEGIGRFKARGRAHIGEYRKHTAIFITSLPQGVNSDSIKVKIEAMVEKGVVDGIADILWEGNDKQVNLVIVLKKNCSTPPEYLLDMIYKYTSLESSYTVNFEAIYGVEHLRFSYKSYLEMFISTAKLTIFRMYCDMYQTVMTRYHQLDAYIKVIQSGEVDNIYKAIRKNESSDLDQLVDWLCKKLSITPLQAGYIIKSDLGKFSKGYLAKYMVESQECWDAKLKYEQIILDDNLIVDELDKILESYEKKFGPRLCRVVKESDTSNIPKGTFKIVITENNYIRKMAENETVNTVKGDYPNYILKVDNSENILLFADTGKVFKLPVHKINVTPKTSQGIDIRTLIKGLTSNVCGVMYEPNVMEASKMKRKHYMIVTSAKNTIKRLDLEDFLTVPPSGIMYTKLNAGDKVVDVSVVADGMDIVIYSDHKALRINSNDIPHYKRNTLGVIAMNTKTDIEGVNVIYNDITNIVVVTRSGRLNKFIVEGLEPSTRAKSGASIIKLKQRDSIVGVYGVNDNNVIRVTSSVNRYDVNVSDIPLGSSVSEGMRLPGMKKEEVIVKAKLV